MIYVMSDFHGEYDKYIGMLEQIDFNDNDTLYVLGDVIDRGSGGIRILQDMMLRANVVPLIGNHELMAVNCLNLLNQEITEDLINSFDSEKIDSLSSWFLNEGMITLKEFKKLAAQERQDIIDYLKEFRLYETLKIKDRKFILVHAGLGDEPKALDDYDINELVWQRPDFERKLFEDPNIYIVVGHTPTPLLSGEAEIYYHNNYIAIDCGAVFEGGRLACLCLDTMTEYYI